MSSKRSESPGGAGVAARARAPRAAAKAPARRVARGKGREALCRALVRIVARDGFDGVTFRAVAAEAGVTHGLASYHFKTREEMIHESLSWAVRETLEASRLAARITGLEGFAAEVPRFVTERPEEAVFQFELLLRAVRNQSLLGEVRSSYDDYVAAVEHSLGSLGIEGEALGLLVFAALDGLTLQQLLYGDPGRAERGLEALRALLRLGDRAAGVPDGAR